jgi:hypothetical protein
VLPKQAKLSSTISRFGVTQACKSVAGGFERNGKPQAEAETLLVEGWALVGVPQSCERCFVTSDGQISVQTYGAHKIICGSSSTTAVSIATVDGVVG